MHFIRKTADLDLWQDAKRWIDCQNGLPHDLWESSDEVDADVDMIEDPEEGFAFASLPSELMNKGKYRTYRAQFKEYLYRHCNMTLYKSPLAKGYAPAGDESDARVYFADRIREARDEQIEKLRDKYEAKLKSLEKKIRTAQGRVDREKSQSRTSMISAGSSIIGALLGGFLGGRRTSASTVARGVGYASQQNADVHQAEAALQLLERDKDDLREQLEQDLDDLQAEYDLHHIELEPLQIPPRKSDLKTEDPIILWTPWQIDPAGIASPLDR